jgi:hypothetical protein
MANSHFSCFVDGCTLRGKSSSSDEFPIFHRKVLRTLQKNLQIDLEMMMFMDFPSKNDGFSVEVSFNFQKSEGNSRPNPGLQGSRHHHGS